MLARLNLVLFGSYLFFTNVILYYVRWYDVCTQYSPYMTVVYTIRRFIFVLVQNVQKTVFYVYTFACVRVVFPIYIYVYNILFIYYYLSCLRDRHVWSIRNTERRSRPFRRNSFFPYIFFLCRQYCTGFILSNPRLKSTANGFVHYIIQYFQVLYLYDCISQACAY